MALLTVLLNSTSSFVCFSSSSSTYCWSTLTILLLDDELLTGTILLFEISRLDLFKSVDPLFFKTMIYDFNLLISAFRDSRFPEESSFIEALFTFMSFTFLANISVDLVSWAETQLGLILAIKWVFEFPPSESFSKNVSFESR